MFGAGLNGKPRRCWVCVDGGYVQVRSWPVSCERIKIDARCRDLVGALRLAYSGWLVHGPTDGRGLLATRPLVAAACQPGLELTRAHLDARMVL